MLSAGTMPHLAHPSALFMYMDPPVAVSGMRAAGTTSADHSPEDQDYPPTALREEVQAEIDRIMENHALIDSASTSSSTATTPISTPTMPASTLPHLDPPPHSPTSPHPLIAHIKVIISAFQNFIVE